MTALRKQHLLMNALAAVLDVADRLKRPEVYELIDLSRGCSGYAVSGETCILTLTGANPEIGDTLVVQSYIYQDGETKSIVLMNGTAYHIKHERVSMLI